MLGMTLVVPQHFGSVVHSMRWTGDAEPLAVTIGVASADAATLADVETIADRFAQAFVDNMLPAMSAIVELIQTEVTFQLAALPADPVVAVSTITDSGAGAGNVLPQNSAFLIHKRTTHGGRGGRGRWYLPGVTEGESDDTGNVTGAHMTALNVALAAYLVDTTSVVPIESAAVLLHNDPGAFAAEDPFVLTAMVCDPVIATQRRRLRK